MRDKGCKFPPGRFNKFAQPADKDYVSEKMPSGEETAMNNKPNQTECAVEPERGRLHLQPPTAGNTAPPVRHTYFNTSALLHRCPGSHAQADITDCVRLRDP